MELKLGETYVITNKSTGDQSTVLIRTLKDSKIYTQGDKGGKPSFAWWTISRFEELFDAEVSDEKIKPSMFRYKSK